ncbi:class I SAM-dependent methyltransferase [Rhodoferax sp.]|uniref:class I SAM-dependent methyltransferase n=1 Tax=Rhodoferax sp. TaxID=50421 RepID=UPI00276FC182|nr:class I SAM-dependent methyltransferase [Rhodoferax sp.]
MPDWMLWAAYSVLVLLAGTALFFFTVTHGALLWRRAVGGSPHESAHVYPIYSNLRLMRLVDYQPVIAAILLFQYDRLVSAITSGLRQSSLRGERVLITSCAFGNVIPRVTAAALEAGARRVQIADIILNELTHAKSKLSEFPNQVEFLQTNATAMDLPDGSVAANVIFFLLHELPHDLKSRALREAGRVLAPGGKLYLAEFHRPDPWVLRALSWTYFKVFEPWGLALWDTHDPLTQLDGLGDFTCQRRTVFFGNFQVIVATKGL